MAEKIDTVKLDVGSIIKNGKGKEYIVIGADLDMGGFTKYFDIVKVGIKYFRYVRKKTVYDMFIDDKYSIVKY